MSVRVRDSKGRFVKVAGATATVVAVEQAAAVVTGQASEGEANMKAGAQVAVVAVEQAVAQATTVGQATGGADMQAGATAQTATGEADMESARGYVGSLTLRQVIDETRKYKGLYRLARGPKQVRIGLYLRALQERCVASGRVNFAAIR